MEIAVLPPQDCLQRHYNHHKSRRHPNRSNRRKHNSKPSTGPIQAQPILGQVRILRRGDPIVKPEPEMTRYAGSSCVTSPPPSELPLPAFFTKSCVLSAVSDDVINNLKIATDLRRVLKLC